MEVFLITAFSVYLLGAIIHFLKAIDVMRNSGIAMYRDFTELILFSLIWPFVLFVLIKQTIEAKKK